MKIALIVQIFRKKKYTDTFLLFMSYTTQCQNLEAIGQIPYEFKLFTVSASIEKIGSRKQC